MRTLVAVAASLAILASCGPAGASFAGIPAPPSFALSAPTPRPFWWMAAPIDGDPSPVYVSAPRTGAAVEGGNARLLRPAVEPGPRRVGIQVGHLRVDEAPGEFPHLHEQVGAEHDGVAELEVNVGIAARVATLLRDKGFLVDVLPATIPPGYLADAFVAVHAESDGGRGDNHGFKIAHGFHRGPYEDELVALLREEYARTTSMDWDDHVTDDMTDYYAFAWYRYEHALAPHTPAAIVETGFLSSAEDRALIVDDPDVPARGIAAGILRFLEAEPRSALYGSEIIVPTVPAPAATPSPRP